MNRCELANEYHVKGYNCAQSVIAAFSDVTHLDEGQAMALASGFGGGAGTGELCGAATGAIMTLGLVRPVDETDPVASKKKAVAWAKEFQSRFVERFRHIRCHDLLKDPSAAEEASAQAVQMGLTKHCDIMIVTAVEITQDMLTEAGIL